MDALLPCPFCGTTPEIYDTDKLCRDEDGYWAGIWCEKCGACGPAVEVDDREFHECVDDVAAAWNRRTPEPDHYPELDAQLDALEAEAEREERWEPVGTKDLTDFLEQGALVETDAYTLSVYRNGQGAMVALPDDIRLCRRVTTEAEERITEAQEAQ